MAQLTEYAVRLGFCLFKYFPYGGLQRDFLSVALQCQVDGHEIYVYTLAWQGEIPAGFNVRIIEAKAWSNHRKYEKYHRQMLRLSAADQLDCVIGFNRMPALDIYLACDPSYKAKPRHPLIRLSARFRHFMDYEAGVCQPCADTHILCIAPAQQRQYQQAWGIADERLTLLPPGISRSAMADASAASHRAKVRAELAVAEDEFLLLLIGSGFRRKGLDRAIRALAALPETLRNKTRLVAIGQDKPCRFNRMAARMGVSQQLTILPGRDDIDNVMQAGDCLLHPAHIEAAGKVILEAVIAGLPILVTDICGYAEHVERAEAGYVLASPFVQKDFNERLRHVLEHADLREQWRRNGIAYGQAEDLYGMVAAAVRQIRRHCREKSSRP